MPHAEKCPICEGSGKTGKPIPPELQQRCHGCYGKGWIEVKDHHTIKPYFQTPGYMSFPRDKISGNRIG